MPPLYVFEDSQVERLFPLTYSRAAFELRSGALTLLERLQKNIAMPFAGVLVRAGMADMVRARVKDLPVNPALSTGEGIVLINARWLCLRGKTPWTPPAADTVGLQQSTIVWAHLSPALAAQIDLSKLHEARTLEAILSRVQRQDAIVPLIGRAWDLFDYQRAAINEDFAALGALNEATVLPGAHLLNPQQIHLSRGVKIWPGAVLDAQGGPIIVQEGTEIRANAVITGPVAIGPHCVIRTQADIREDNSFGPGCRIGGEVIHSIFLGHANKQHHGFVGQSIVGEWANLGAGTTTSNLKNTYGTIRMPASGAAREESTGRQFLGSIIADHAKLGIGTYLSTGSVVGFGSHITVPRPPRFVPSFAWLTDRGMRRAEFEKIVEIAKTVMYRRGIAFSPAEHELFVRIASEWSTAEQFPWSE